MNTKIDNHAIGGIHHITAVTASAAENYRFYTQVLGLRLVKKTVNFDDPFTYHLYYGDDAGRPGTILTFFPWEQLPQGKPGAGMLSAIGFAVPRLSIGYWSRRLNDNGISVDTVDRFGEPVIRFCDPHGLSLELIGTTPKTVAESSSDSKTDITGFHSATLLSSHIDATKTIIVEGMGMTLEQQEGSRYRFRMADDGTPGRLLDLLVDPSAPQGRPGGGTVHHIAFRTRNDEGQRHWQKTLRSHGLSVTEVRDRHYFRSIYFHEPGGALFEIATDPPGFAVDENLRQLGTALKLPPRFESLRGEIEAQLPPLAAPDFKHVFLPSESGSACKETIVGLHGTGGNERDLIPLIERIAPGYPLISPRGKVLENGMARFFERLAEGVFNEADVRRRAHELADFLSDAATRYQRSTDQLVALGYSNGANVAAAILLLRPDIFSRAVLFRPMMPIHMRRLPDLTGKSILITTGRFDRIVPAAETRQLIRSLKAAGASVKAVHVDAGHELTQTDVDVAQSWFLSGSERQCTHGPCMSENVA